jgi:hypothetical protein
VTIRIPPEALSLLVGALFGTLLLQSMLIGFAAPTLLAVLR